MTRFRSLLARFFPPNDSASILKQAYGTSLDLQRERLDTQARIRFLEGEVSSQRAKEQFNRSDYIERCSELAEARQMAGSGPWLVAEARGKSAGSTKELTTALREANPIISQGAYGDIELALQNVEWKREINLSWLEFSRWGIQQIILISRLYYIKNPIIRRLIDVCALYVFGRGVEVSSPDSAANDVIADFMERNKCTLGQTALMELEARKYYDGNIFFVLFPDPVDKGLVNVRTIDAVEVMDVITDPEDTDRPWFYRRTWTQRAFNTDSGMVEIKAGDAWYPALGFEPADKPVSIAGVEVRWNSPVLHRKSGGVSKWHFGCPKIYPALDWAKASRKFLESCATVREALSNIAVIFTTKGGQQALEGIKTQLGTTVGPSSSLWDTNPPPVKGSILGMGPGSTFQALKTQGSGGEPEDVRRFLHQCCMTVGVPETFLADVSTGNLATATTLDRPTELKFSADQECWVEDITTMVRFGLAVSKGAPSGRLREARSSTAKPVEINVTFPSIREGDTPAIIGAIVNAMTLGNKMGEVMGIDERAGVLAMLRVLDIDNAEEIVEEMYPLTASKDAPAYDPNRTAEPPEPVADPNVPQPDPSTPKPAVKPGKPTVKKIKEAAARLSQALRMIEVEGSDE